MKHIGEISVREYMTDQAIVVDDTTRLVEAIKTMDDNRISVIPVVDQQGELVGILSSTDLIEMVHEIQADLGALHCVNESTRDFLIKMPVDQGDNTKVMDVMTAPVETISADANLVIAAQKLCKCKCHHLPVVDANGSSIGLLGATDFVRAIAENGALCTN